MYDKNCENRVYTCSSPTNLTGFLMSNHLYAKKLNQKKFSINDLETSIYRQKNKTPSIPVSSKREGRDSNRSIEAY